MVLELAARGIFQNRKKNKLRPSYLVALPVVDFGAFAVL
jgi:hypothetical protein